MLNTIKDLCRKILQYLYETTLQILGEILSKFSSKNTPSLAGLTLQVLQVWECVWLCNLSKHSLVSYFCYASHIPHIYETYNWILLYAREICMGKQDIIHNTFVHNFKRTGLSYQSVSNYRLSSLRMHCCYYLMSSRMQSHIFKMYTRRRLPH